MFSQSSILTALDRKYVKDPAAFTGDASEEKTNEHLIRGESVYTVNEIFQTDQVNYVFSFINLVMRTSTSIM